MTFIHSDFEISNIGAGGAEMLLVSKDHQNPAKYHIAIGATGKAYSDIPSEYEPTPNDIFFIQGGVFDCDIGAQVNIIYRLEGAAGTTVDNTVEGGLVVLDPDFSGFAGTLTETKPVYRWVGDVPTRPSPLPMLGPIITSDT